LPRGRGGDLEEGLAPLLNALLFNSGRVKERRSLSYPKTSPLSLEGEGDRGEGISDWAENPKILS